MNYAGFQRPAHSKLDGDMSNLISPADAYSSPMEWPVSNDNKFMDDRHYSCSRSSSSRSSRSASESSANSSLGLGGGNDRPDNDHTSATETDLDSDVHSDDIDADFEKLESLRTNVRRNLQLRPLRIQSLHGDLGDTTVILTPQSATHVDSAVSDDTFYDFGQSPTSSTHTRSASAFSDYDNDTDVYYTPTTEIGSAPPSARWIGSASAINGFGFGGTTDAVRSDSPVGGSNFASQFASLSSQRAQPVSRPYSLDPSSLLTRLPKPIGSSTRPLLIDTRPLSDFLQTRVWGSVNVAIPSLIMRRFQNRIRKPSKPPVSAGLGASAGGLCSLEALRMYVTTESGRAVWDALMGGEGSSGRINSGWNGDVVVYDEDMEERDQAWQREQDFTQAQTQNQNLNQSQNSSLAWSLIPLLSPLVPGSVYFLEGGFTAFRLLAKKSHEAECWVSSGEEYEGVLNPNGQVGERPYPTIVSNLGALDKTRSSYSSEEHANLSTLPTIRNAATKPESSLLPPSIHANARSSPANGLAQSQTPLYTPSPRKGGLFHLDIQNPPRTKIIPEIVEQTSSASSSTPSSSSSTSQSLAHSQTQHLTFSPPTQTQFRSYSLSPPSTYKYPSSSTMSPPSFALQIKNDTPSPSPSALMFPHKDNRPRKASVPNLRRIDTSSMERIGHGNGLPKLSLKTSVAEPRRPHRASTLAGQPMLRVPDGPGSGLLDRLGPLSPMRLTTDFPSLHRPYMNGDARASSSKFLSPDIHLNGSIESLPLSPKTPVSGLPLYDNQQDLQYPLHPPTPRADSVAFNFGSASSSRDPSPSPSPSPSPFPEPPTTDTDNPMPAFSISTILPQFLFLGPELSQQEHVDELLALGVKRILNIAIECDDDLGLSLRDKFERYEKIPMRDNVEEENVEKSVKLACEMLDDARLHSAPTYVHCKAGKSRSVTAVIAYLIHANHWTLSKAYAFVVERRKGISPNIGFVSELMNFEEQELGRKSMGVGLGPVSGSSPGLSSGNGGEDSGKSLSVKPGSGKAGRRGHHARESLPPTFQPQPVLSESSLSMSITGESNGLGNPEPSPDLVDSSHEVEVKDASGRYRHLRRAPVDETTLQPSRRMSKAGLESAFSMGPSSVSSNSTEE